MNITNLNSIHDEKFFGEVNTTLNSAELAVSDVSRVTCI